MGPCNIMLKHEVMVADEWHDNGPKDLITVSLCIQIAIDKMKLCSLSLDYACPCNSPPPPWGTRFTTLTSANRSPTRRHTHGLWLWGWLDILPNSQKLSWRQLHGIENHIKLSGNSSCGHSCNNSGWHFSLKTWDICGIVLCVKTAHFRVAFYCPQHKVHLCNDHAV